MKSNTVGLTILARQNALNQEDWLALLEARRTLIEPHLRSMSLKAVGDLKVVRDDIDRGPSSGRKLRMGNLKKFHSDFPPYTSGIESCPLRNVQGRGSLDTRGIFADDEVFFHGHYHWEFVRESEQSPATGQILRFWGLTRDGIWIKIECHMEYVEDRRVRRTKVNKVTISESHPLEICEFCHVTLRWLWERLGDAAEGWLKHRQELLVQAEHLALMIRQENSLASIIEQK